MRTKKHQACAAVCLLALASVTLAAPGRINVTITPPGPVTVGDVFTVTLQINAYTDTNEIDGVRLNVTYPRLLLSFVTNSFDLGAGSGSAQQWLAKANQEPSENGFLLVSSNRLLAPGRIEVWMWDAGASNPERGTLAGSGHLISFSLRADAEGTGLINLLAHDGPAGKEVLYGTTGAPAPGPAPTFFVAAVTVQPRPSLNIIPDGTNVLISWLAPAAGFRLQGTSNLTPEIVWTEVTQPVVTTNGLNLVVAPNTGSRRFFRLCRP